MSERQGYFWDDEDEGDTVVDPYRETRAARSEAIQRVEVNADEDWRQAAYIEVRYLATTHVAFTADEVWDRLAGSGYSTHEPSALGPVFLRASKAGLIVKTGETRLSRFSRRHRDLTVWVGT